MTNFVFLFFSKFSIFPKTETFSFFQFCFFPKTNRKHASRRQPSEQSRASIFASAGRVTQRVFGSILPVEKLPKWPWSGGGGYSPRSPRHHVSQVSQASSAATQSSAGSNGNNANSAQISGGFVSDRYNRSDSPMETVVLEKTIIKLGSLLVLGFGKAGTNIISTLLSI